MTTTPIMGMILPDVSVTPGPLWASMLNAAFMVIDGHTHAAGSGTAVGAAGLNIQSDLTLNSNDLTTIRTTRFSDQTAIVLTGTDIRALYSKNGDLYYRNAALAEVQLTSGGVIGAGTGNITGLISPAAVTYSPGTGSYAFTTGPNLAGKIAVSDIAIYEYGNASAQPVTLKSPAGVVAHTWILPAIAPPQSGVIGITIAGQVTNGLVDGTVSAPSMYFSSDPNTGIYAFATAKIGFATGGVTSLNVTTAGLRAKDGTNLLPSYSFDADSDTGMYRPASNTVALTAGGTERLRVTSTGVEISGTFGNSSGTAAAPTYAFTAETNTGMYLDNTNQIGWSIGGVQRLELTASGLFGVDGTAAAPTYSFLSDPDTGMYRGGLANTLAFSTGGVVRGSFNTTVMNSQLPLQFVGGTALKWDSFTHSLGASPSNVSNATGFTLHAVMGWDETTGIPIGADAAVLKFVGTGAADTYQVSNLAGGAKTIRVVILYS